MKILSVCDGHSSARLILKNLNVPVEKYYASEVNNNAIKVSKDNFEDITHVGDIRDVGNLDIDFLCGGTPCQSLSVQGRGEGLESNTLEEYLKLKKDNYDFKGTSFLFWEYVRLLRELKPTYFFLENVSMKKEFSDIITKELGVEPQTVNSKIFVPQSRKRMYWTNIPFKGDFNVNRNLKIEDILEDKVDENYFLTTLQKSKLNLNFKWAENEIVKHKAGGHQQDIIYRFDGIMGCLSASTNGAARHLTKTYLPNGDIRRLTEVECERLMGLPDNYTKAVSSSPRYELCGNGWEINTVIEFFKGLNYGN